MSRYVKAIIAILGGISAWGITAAADDAITQVELYGLLGTLATALGVYAFPNTPPEGEPADPAISEQGHGELLLLVAAGVTIWLGVIFTAWAFESGPFS